MKNEDKFKEVLETLKRIADSFEKDSKEYQAIERATFGLHYINQLKVEDNFLKFVNEIDQPLSEDQISHLQSMGLNLGKYKEP